MKSGAEVDRPQAGGYNVETNSSIRRRIFASGSRPSPPAMLSSICCGLLVAGITQVTAGWATIHFRKKWAQDRQLISAAHGGRGFAATRPNKETAPKGRIINTAM